MDGVNIQGYTNQQAVEVLRHTGQTVHLKLMRRGFRPDEIGPAPVQNVTISPPSSSINTGNTTANSKVTKELEVEREKSEETTPGGKDTSDINLTRTAQNTVFVSLSALQSR